MILFHHLCFDALLSCSLTSSIVCFFPPNLIGFEINLPTIAICHLSEESRERQVIHPKLHFSGEFLITFKTSASKMVVRPNAILSDIHRDEVLFQKVFVLLFFSTTVSARCGSHSSLGTALTHKVACSINLPERYY